MELLDKGGVACLDEGVVECLYNNNKGCFDVGTSNSLDDCF